MHKQICIPGWSELKKEEQEVFQAWLQSFIDFLRIDIKLKQTFSYQDREPENSGTSALEHLLNTNDSITIEVVDSIGEEEGLNTDDLVRLSANFPDRIPDAVCDAICAAFPNSTACNNCRK